MQVTFPTGEPSGFKSFSSKYLETNHSVGGQVLFGKDTLLFKFYNFYDAVEIQVDLSDDQRNGPLASEVVSAGPYNGAVFIQFEGFPPRGDQAAPMESCNYLLTLINVGSPNAGTRVDVNVLVPQ